MISDKRELRRVLWLPRVVRQGPRADCCDPGPLCLTREHRIEEGSGALEGRCQVGIETNLLGESAIGRCPLRRWGRQAFRERLAGAGLEGVL